VGPLSGSVANQTGVAAPCRGDNGARSPPISVRTQPGQAELTSPTVSSGKAVMALYQNRSHAVREPAERLEDLPGMLTEAYWRCRAAACRRR